VMASSGMSGSDEKKERCVIKMPTTLRQNKKEQMNIRKMVAQQTGSLMTCNSAVPKNANKSCLKKLEIDEELHQRYQQAKNFKRKI
jgi:hypothetical protein